MNAVAVALRLGDGPRRAGRLGRAAGALRRIAAHPAAGRRRVAERGGCGGGVSVRVGAAARAEPERGLAQALAGA